GLRQTANEINTFICNNLPHNDENIDTIISKPIDIYDGQLFNNNNNLYNFKNHTNLPDEIIIQEGAR
ncbi:22712_t:CDS:1, partial [Gigaspora rosea]